MDCVGKMEVMVDESIPDTGNGGTQRNLCIISAKELMRTTWLLALIAHSDDKPVKLPNVYVRRDKIWKFQKETVVATCGEDGCVKLTLSNASAPDTS
ncbi:unnamed protein product [Cylicostephanus goldi]|uniref:Uncharacterized protein n=1 Tax=Cylicostephanus goldi TaxID=71465 RepID=A0A3P7MTB3_CYLGO|nr:unnamed protein product [Cylicostephanus goldi]